MNAIKGTLALAAEAQRLARLADWDAGPWGWGNLIADLYLLDRQQDVLEGRVARCVRATDTNYRGGK